MLADDLKALLDALGVSNPHYCGLSMGGMIGQTFALRYPGVFRTLMLADTTSGFPAQAGPLWQERIRIAEEKGMQPLVQPTLERWFTEAFRKSNPAPVDGIARLIASTPVAGYVGCCHAIPKINVTARLREIKAPILVICGDMDPGTPPAMSETIRDNAPGSKLVMIPQAAHLSNLEQPALFTKAMQEFMATH
jgi:3-oxoadipate enol-lactonase